MINQISILNLKNKYLSAKPYPNIIIDDFFKKEVAENIFRELSEYDYKKLHSVHYDSALEKKFACNHYDRFPPNIYNAFIFLNSAPFVNIIKELTNTEKVYVDVGLHGGGMHFHERGGKLNLHQDYSVHPKIKLKRKFNLIIYMTENWKESYGGHLEMWSHDNDTNEPRQCVKKILPKYNRAILFDTTHNSWHGLPEELKCPPDIVRQSLAIYYLTEADKDTNKRPRALFVPTQKQQNDLKVRKLIEERTKINGPSSTS
mgnify:FL=1|tara:strand:+ start:72 stop:848 length:777 start_codon:yes stop_codon:yes gene_type:complete